MWPKSGNKRTVYVLEVFVYDRFIKNQQIRSNRNKVFIFCLSKNIMVDTPVSLT